VARTVDHGASGGGVASSSGDVANPPGRIPVVEYHLIGDSEGRYARTRENFRKDMQLLYDRGYRPITVAQMLDRDFSLVPAGKSPVVFTFDDASPDQFRYIERDGKLEIDPSSAIGIWLDFARSHPEWKGKATFCMLNGAGAGHNFFGDNPTFDGQKKEWRLQKVKWLADNGFELCAHTLWHAQLNKYTDAVVQEQIARNLMGIDSAVAGYKVRTFALPYGVWPKNRPLAWEGEWTDPKSGRRIHYNFDAVLEVAGGPARSPFDPKYNPRSINRIEVFGNELAKVLDALDKPGARFVK
jgi:peptidoglycan/xylan/chitin deacetylase (PgdA/CDA1 family)